jgi:hypothetical protein
MPSAGSGTIYIDNAFFRQIPAPTATNWTALIPFAATWRYNTNTTPPAGWTNATYNDTAWPSAPAKFGAGSGPTNVITRLPQYKTAYYFRKQFTLGATGGETNVSTPADVEDLLLSATCTDDPSNNLHLWINGTPITSQIDTVTPQGNETRYYDLTPFNALLVPGLNTIAVQLNNAWSSWDDVAFDLRLQAVLTHRPRPRLNVNCATPAAPVVTVETPPGTIWKLESTDTLAPPSWQPMITLTNTLGTAMNIIDTGQGSRLLPTVAKTRYYRLVPF